VAQDKTVNEICAVCNAPVDEDYARDYMGSRVGFCCDECRSEWDEMSAEEKNERLAEVGLRE
jgi:hypothetical protein